MCENVTKEALKSLIDLYESKPQDKYPDLYEEALSYHEGRKRTEATRISFEIFAGLCHSHEKKFDEIMPVIFDLFKTSQNCFKDEDKNQIVEIRNSLNEYYKTIRPYLLHRPRGSVIDKTRVVDELKHMEELLKETSHPKMRKNVQDFIDYYSAIMRGELRPENVKELDGELYIFQLRHVKYKYKDEMEQN